MREIRPSGLKGGEVQSLAPAPIIWRKCIGRAALPRRPDSAGLGQQFGRSDFDLVGEFTGDGAGLHLAAAIAGHADNG